MSKCWVVTEGDHSDYQIVAIYATEADADAHAAPKEIRCYKCSGTGRSPEEHVPAFSRHVTTCIHDECVLIGGVQFVGGTNPNPTVIPERECARCHGKGGFMASYFAVEEHDLA